MFNYVSTAAVTSDQGARAQRLFAAVVLAALDDAIVDDKKYGNGGEQIKRWARSRDGREVLMCAGLSPSKYSQQSVQQSSTCGHSSRTSVALSREESERQAAA